MRKCNVWTHRSGRENRDCSDLLLIRLTHVRCLHIDTYCEPSGLSNTFTNVSYYQSGWIFTIQYPWQGNLIFCCYLVFIVSLIFFHFTPPPEILHLACYSLNDYLISYILQILSFTSVQLNKSDVDMKGTVTEKSSHFTQLSAYLWCRTKLIFFTQWNIFF